MEALGLLHACQLALCWCSRWSSFAIIFQGCIPTCPAAKDSQNRYFLMITKLSLLERVCNCWEYPDLLHLAWYTAKSPIATLKLVHSNMLATEDMQSNRYTSYITLLVFVLVFTPQHIHQRVMVLCVCYNPTSSTIVKIWLVREVVTVIFMQYTELDSISKTW